MRHKIKLFPIFVALVTCTGDVSLERNNSFSSKAIFYEHNDSSFDSSDIVLTSLDKTFTTTSFTTTSITTETSTTSTTTEISTTEGIYKDLMFLEDLCDGYDSERIHEIIDKYSIYCNLPYDDCVSVLNANIDRIISYSSFEEGVMCTLFECFSEQGLLSSYCVDNSKVTRSMNRDEIESIMLDICDVMGLSSDDRKIVLAIFRWETGNGTSYLCVNSNNYGGIRVSNGSFGIYQTPEYGMYRAILCMYGHICRARSNGCDDIYNILSCMSRSYCPGTAEAWTNSIYGMVSVVSNDYDSLKKI